MLEKKTVVDQIEIARDGTVNFRLGLLLVEDGVEIDRKWHRSGVEPGGDVDAQLSAVNGHLAQMGRLAVSGAEIKRIKAHANVAWTPDVVAAHKRRVAERQAQIDAELKAAAEQERS